MAKGRDITDHDFGGNQLLNARHENLAAAPSPLGVGHTYFDTKLCRIRTYNGTTWDSAPKIQVLACATAAATVAKVITQADYVLTVGDILAVTFTLGNTASSATVAINGSADIQIRTAAGQPTAASSTGAAYAAVNGTMLFYYNGEYLCLMGSQDLTDGANYSDIIGAYVSNYKVHDPTNGGTQAYVPIIGICEDGTIEKITATSNSTAAGARTFTSNKISLKDNIFYDGWSLTTAWTAGSAYAGYMFSPFQIGTTNWKYAIGNYYNKSGVLVTNAVTTDLVQAPLYIGGIRQGNYFTPSEFSLTLRNTNLVYKRVGTFGTTGSLYWSEYQDVFIYRDGAWQNFSKPDTLPNPYLLILRSADGSEDSYNGEEQVVVNVGGSADLSTPWQYASFLYVNGYILYRKNKIGMVEVSWDFDEFMCESGNSEMMPLPVGFRPSHMIFLSCSSERGDGLPFILYEDGELMCLLDDGSAYGNRRRVYGGVTFYPQ